MSRDEGQVVISFSLQEKVCPRETLTKYIHAFGVFNGGLEIVISAIRNCLQIIRIIPFQNFRSYTNVFGLNLLKRGLYNIFGECVA